jgi:DNA-binding NarL/FixJ family response regulator
MDDTQTALLADSPLFDVAPRRRFGKLRLILVDDHPVVRAGLHELLKLEADFDIIGEAGTAIEGIALALRMKPDIIITDISLGAKNGIYLITELGRLAPGSKVIVLTVHNDNEYIRAALAAGARGYVLKDSGRADLVQAIRSVDNDEYYMCPRVAQVVVSGYLAGSFSASDLKMAYELTEREREVITLVAQGRSNKRIATHLDLSVKTVGKHRSNFMRKLNLHNCAAITMFAISHGLVSPDEVGQQPQH